MEIERKFLVDKDNALKFIGERCHFLSIIQGYLNTMDDKYLIRYRSIDNNLFILEIKGRGLLSREELSYDITKEQFDSVFHLLDSVLAKKRYIGTHNDLKFELDDYEDYDFYTVEVEFESELKSKMFNVPGWFGKEVTYDPKYKNINLAKKN